MYLSRDRILTSHVGSLPRPPDVLERIYARQAGTRLFDDDYWRLVAAAVDDVVAHQARIGIDIVSDGEIGKVGFTNYLGDRLTGLGGEGEMWSFHDLEEAPEIAARQYQGEGARHICMPACVGALEYVGQAHIARDLANLRRALDAHGIERAFVPAPLPGAVAFQIVNRHYATYEDYVMALAECLQEEYRAIVDAGFLLQLDSPDIPMCAPQHSVFWASDVVAGMGYQAFIALNLAALERATEGIPGEHLRLHLCWANYEGPHHHDVALAEVLEPSLRLCRAKTISFEAANPRHEHEWAVFESLRLPDDVVIMPGVIDTSTNFVEHPELVAQRIERFARLVGRERVIAGTDCGFGTYAGFGEVTPGAVWLKLASLAEGAAIASRRLWG